MIILNSYNVTLLSMSYVKNNLVLYEQIIHFWKIHWFYVFICILCVAVWLVCFFIWIIWEYLLAIWWGFTFIVFFGYKIISFASMEIALTDKRIIYKSWIISRNVFELPLEKVESIVLDQSIFQRIIWAWTLVVHWIWGQRKAMRLLHNPIEMRRMIYEEIEEVK